MAICDTRQQMRCSRVSQEKNAARTYVGGFVCPVVVFALSRRRRQKCMNAVKNTGVPESSVLGTPDKHAEKSIDSVIQYSCMLRGTVQVNVPEFPRPEMTTPPTTQSTDKKRNDRLVTNQSEAFSGLCKLVLLR